MPDTHYPMRPHPTELFVTAIIVVPIALTVCALATPVLAALRFTRRQLRKL